MNSYTHTSFYTSNQELKLDNVNKTSKKDLDNSDTLNNVETFISLNNNRVEDETYNPELEKIREEVDRIWRDNDTKRKRTLKQINREKNAITKQYLPCVEALKTAAELDIKITRQNARKGIDVTRSGKPDQLKTWWFYKIFGWTFDLGIDRILPNHEHFRPIYRQVNLLVRADVKVNDPVGHARMYVFLFIVFGPVWIFILWCMHIWTWNRIPLDRIPRALEPDEPPYVKLDDLELELRQYLRRTVKYESKLVYGLYWTSYIIFKLYPNIPLEIHRLFLKEMTIYMFAFKDHSNQEYDSPISLFNLFCSLAHLRYVFPEVFLNFHQKHLFIRQLRNLVLKNNPDIKLQETYPETVNIFKLNSNNYPLRMLLDDIWEWLNDGGKDIDRVVNITHNILIKYPEYEKNLESLVKKQINLLLEFHNYRDVNIQAHFRIIATVLQKCTDDLDPNLCPDLEKAFIESLLCQTKM